MTLGARVVGIIRRPRATLEAVVTAPRWLGMMACTTAVSSAANALLFQTEVGRFALVDEWERLVLALGQPVNDARYEQLHGLSQHGALYGVALALLTGPVATLGVSAALFLAFRKGRTAFRPILAVATHAGVIVCLRQVIAAPLAYARETTASATSLAAWLPAPAGGSPVGSLFGLLDVFVVWWAVVLAVGASVLWSRSARRLSLAFVGAYVAGALVLAIVLTALGGAT